MLISLGKKCFHLQKSLLKAAKAFSTTSLSHNITSSADAYVTLEKNPACHTKNDIGLFYTLPNSLSLNILFPGKVLVSEQTDECKTFKETPFLIRKPALEIINYLKNSDYDAPVNKYVLYGRFGSGKSITMCHVIHYAYEEKWLIVHIPRILSWLYSKAETTESATVEGCLDVPAEATKWLLQFKSQNEGLLNSLDLKIENTYKWNIKEENKKGESLLNLINHGITRTRYACDVIIALLNEVKILSKSRKVKTLVAIDGYNFIFHEKTKRKNKEKRLVSPEEISCVKAFKDLAKADWHNGAVVLTCDTTRNMNYYKDYFPMNQLRRSGFEFLDPFIPVEVPPLTDKEMTSILTYYRSKKWLLNSEGDNELKFLSAGNPLTLRRLCGPL